MRSAVGGLRGDIFHLTGPSNCIICDTCRYVRFFTLGGDENKCTGARERIYTNDNTSSTAIVCVYIYILFSILYTFTIYINIIHIYNRCTIQYNNLQCSQQMRIKEFTAWGAYTIGRARGNSGVGTVKRAVAAVSSDRPFDRSVLYWQVTGTCAMLSRAHVLNCFRNTVTSFG